MIFSSEIFIETLLRERNRADRNRHFLSLIAFDVASVAGNRFAEKRIVRTIYRRVRNIDEIGWYDKWHIGVILPYTSAAGAWNLANEICKSVGITNAHPVCTVYSYPSGNI